MKEYKKRVADQILSDRLESSGTVLISSVSCFRPSEFPALGFLLGRGDLHPDHIVLQRAALEILL